jgi:hypothetical protein
MEIILNFIRYILFAPLFLTLLSACPAAVPDPLKTEETVCDTGYTLDGDECVDDDECAADENPCSDNATCSNIDGSYECACNDGYDGDECADVDECATDNGGCAQTCTNTDGSFECGCEAGYSLNADGAACDDNDECSRENGGCEQNCTNSDGAFTCSCDEGYALNADGLNCDDVDECATDNGGCEGTSVCANTEGSFECTCADGFAYGAATATDADAGAASGMDCTDVDECAADTDSCQDTSTCSNTVGSYECLCGTGSYYGEVAAANADAGPATMACLDFNACATANCTSGGDTTATCTDAAAPAEGFSCTCGTGYTDDGTTCADTDGCAAANCTSGGDATAICNDAAAPAEGFSCTCSSGYTDDGTACEDDNECTADNGGCAQTCTNTAGSFSCSCGDGYTLNTDGLTCDNIDECTEGTDDCAGTSTCSDTVGSFECLCDTGYEYGEFEGTDGGMGGMDCVDTNECLAYESVSFTKPEGEHEVQDCINDTVCLARGNNGSLYNGAVETSAAEGGCSGTTSPAGTQWAWGACLGNTNEWGSFLSATDCGPRDAVGFTMCLHLVDSDTYYDVVLEGYTGGGAGGGFAYTRTLVSGGPCGAGDAQCTNEEGSFTCSCSEGFETDTDGNCIDIDECATETDDECSSNSVCANTLGSYDCECLPGYFGQGDNYCEQINECRSGLDNCHEFATCDDTDGSFTCECIAPATGDGVTCEVTCDEACGTNEQCGLDLENTEAVCFCSDGYERDEGNNCVATNRCLNPGSVDFVKPSFTSAADCITPDICITRLGGGPMFNAAFEKAPNHGYDDLGGDSPHGTLWYGNSCAAAKTNGHIDENGETLTTGELYVPFEGAFKELITSADYLCGIKNDDSLWCSETAEALVLTEVSAGTTWRGLSMSDIHRCAINLTDDTLWCWGNNNDGQLGNDSTSSASEPQNVMADKAWSSVSAGRNHTCAIDSDNLLHCWGANSNGQLGQNNTDNSSVPLAVSASTWSSVSAGLNLTCAIDSNKALYCWGRNNEAQTGSYTGDTSSENTTSGNDVLVPTAVASGTLWTEISTGQEHACGIQEDGSLWCWGSNEHSEMGNGATTDNNDSAQDEQRLAGPVNVAVGMTQWQNVDAAMYHTCAQADGMLWCWGYNERNNFGVPNAIITQLTNEYKLVSVPTPAKVLEAGSSFDTSEYWTCGINAQSETWCIEAEIDFGFRRYRSEIGSQLSDGICMYLPSQGLFFDISNSDWQSGGEGGAFSYTRTPYNPVVDGSTPATVCGHNDATCTWADNAASCSDCPEGFVIDDVSGMCASVHTCESQPCGAGAVCEPLRAEPYSIGDYEILSDHRCECDVVEFEKPNYETDVQDCINPDVCIARNNSSPLYNSVYENSSDAGNGGCTGEPSFTSWTYKTCNEALSDDFGPFFSSFIDRCGEGQTNGLDAYSTNMRGKHGCMRTHAPADDSVTSEWDFEFVHWQGGSNGGGFSYRRFHEKADGESCSSGN